MVIWVLSFISIFLSAVGRMMFGHVILFCMCYVRGDKIVRWYVGSCFTFCLSWVVRSSKTVVFPASQCPFWLHNSVLWGWDPNGTLKVVPEEEKIINFYPVKFRWGTQLCIPITNTGSFCSSMLLWWVECHLCVPLLEEFPQSLQKAEHLVEGLSDHWCSSSFAVIVTCSMLACS